MAAFGEHGQSDAELESDAKKIPSLRPHFKGVYSKDTIPFIRSEECVIINIQDSQRPDGTPLPGTHWVAAGKHANESWYFDSFGLSVPENIKQKLSGHIVHYPTEIQGPDSEMCGWYALGACAAIYQKNIAPSKTLAEYLKRFDRPNLTENDPVLKSYLNQIIGHSGTGLHYEHSHPYLDRQV